MPFAVPLRMLSALQRYKRPTPTPATNEGIERVLAKPVRPPTMHKPPMVYAGTADMIYRAFGARFTEGTWRREKEKLVDWK